MDYQPGLLGPVVEAPAIRLLIREKLKDGWLPYDSMPRFWGGAGNGEQCDACDEAISKDELVMEGIASTPSNKKPIQFHVVCFQLWDTARRVSIRRRLSSPQSAHAPHRSRSSCQESRSRMGAFIAFAARVGSKYSRRNAILPPTARRNTTYS